MSKENEGQEEDGVVGTPCQKSPVGPMPETTNEENDEGVEHHAALGNTATSHGDVDIVSKPSGQRDMPPPPKFSQITAEIRYIEIAPETDAEEFGATDGNVAIS